MMPEYCGFYQAGGIPFKEKHWTVYFFMLMIGMAISILLGVLFLFWGISNYGGSWYNDVIDIVLTCFILCFFWGVPVIMAAIGFVELDD